MVEKVEWEMENLVLFLKFQNRHYKQLTEIRNRNHRGCRLETVSGKAKGTPASGYHVN
jgi:hypothetical protein